MNAILLVTTACAVAMLLIPNTISFYHYFWIGTGSLFVLLFVFGSKNRSLKNRYTDPQGYIVLKDPNEYEHRHIAKLTLNRNLFRNEVVHHINGKRADNRLINLCVMDRHQHELFHAWLDWKVKKSRKYPSFKEQKQILTNRHNGILLQNYSFKNRPYQPPVRHTFIIRRTEAITAENSDAFSRRLFADLRHERNRIANERNIPAYLVFKNFTLTEMARSMPDNAETMRDIIGVTPDKFRLYGNQFLAVIWKYKSETQGSQKKV